MITRIELTNFMSHRRTVIEPAAGLTVLVGPNNCGKSAVVAALQILCRNENSTYVLRHGEKECGITLHTDDGHVIEWRRKNSPSYRIDGQAFDRLGRNGVPDELHEVLRLPLVDGGADTDFDVHFGAQKSPIFLLGSSAQNAARFFASSSDAFRLMAMQKRHKEKFSEAQREKNRLEAKSTRLTAELDALAPMVDLDDLLSAAEQLFGEVALCEAALADARKLETAWSQQLAALDRQSATNQVLSRLPPPPVLAPVEALSRLILSLASEEQRRRAAVARIDCLSTMTAPPIQSDVLSLEQTSERLARQRGVVQQWQSETIRLAALSAPPELSDVDLLAQLLEGLRFSQQRAGAATNTSRALADLNTPPELHDDTELRQIVSTLARLSDEVQLVQRRNGALTHLADPPIAAETASLAQLVDKLAAASSEAQRLANLLKEEETALAEAAAALRNKAEGALCPVCGNKFDADRLLALSETRDGGHAHD